MKGSFLIFQHIDVSLHPLVVTINTVMTRVFRWCPTWPCFFTSSTPFSLPSDGRGPKTTTPDQEKPRATKRRQNESTNQRLNSCWNKKTKNDICGFHEFSSVIRSMFFVFFFINAVKSWIKSLMKNEQLVNMNTASSLVPLMTFYNWHYCRLISISESADFYIYTFEKVVRNQCAKIIESRCFFFFSSFTVTSPELYW